MQNNACIELSQLTSNILSQRLLYNKKGNKQPSLTDSVSKTLSSFAYSFHQHHFHMK